jgi:hypothetical protein
MGIEYRISCAPAGLPKIEELLRRLGGEPSSRFPNQIEFRFRPYQLDEMPDATVAIEPQGIYFLDSCAEREQVAVLFRQIIDEALTFSHPSDSVVVTSL